MSSSAVTRAEIYPVAPGLEPSGDYRLFVDGREVFVHHCHETSYALLGLSGPAEVEIRPARPFESVKVRPLRMGLPVERTGEGIRLALPGPVTISVEFDGDIARPLLIWACPPEADRPDPADPGVLYYPGGQVHEVGLVQLSQGQSVYIEPGAVVRGAFHAHGLDGVRVAGRGMLDGRDFPHGRQPGRTHMLRFLDCRDVHVEGIAVVDSPAWTCVPVGCDRVRIDGLKIITYNGGGDGIDLVGCRDVEVRRVFARTNDDCVAVKASRFRYDFGGRDVRGIRVSESVFWNASWGNALEIGYETQCDSMSDIVFRDCDVIHCEHEGWQSGAVLSIHNGDSADVHDVLFEDIRVEGAEQKLIDFKILVARYTRTTGRGQIRDVVVRDVRVVDGPTPVSIVRGHEGSREENEVHAVRDVTFENLQVDARPAGSALEARMVVEVSQNIRFLAGNAPAPTGAGEGRSAAGGG